NFFGTTLYPQDLTLLALLFVIAAFGLFFITTFLGRVWCGYLCPQTVWTFMYIWFEEKLEGSANKRRKQDANKLTANLAMRKTLKHIAWFAIALATGFTFVGYFVPMKQLVIDFFTFNANFWPVFWVMFFAICTYGNAGWMRSIMCIHMCPYARFQSAMFDKDTFIVG
ncbi:4Fe-4S binding protein, partial [Vibrio sp. 1403]